MGHKPFITDKPRFRPARLATRLKEELITMVPGELKDPIFETVTFVTIIAVEVTPDMKNATVSFTLAEDEEKHAKKVTAVLNAAAGFLRRELMQILQMKFTPQLIFKHDKGYKNIAHIDALLKTISHSAASDRGDDDSSDPDPASDEDV